MTDHVRGWVGRLSLADVRELIVDGRQEGATDEDLAAELGITPEQVALIAEGADDPALVDLLSGIRDRVAPRASAWLEATARGAAAPLKHERATRLN